MDLKLNLNKKNEDNNFLKLNDIIENNIKVQKLLRETYPLKNLVFKV